MDSITVAANPILSPRWSRQGDHDRNAQLSPRSRRAGLVFAFCLLFAGCGIDSRTLGTSADASDESKDGATANRADGSVDSGSGECTGDPRSCVPPNPDGFHADGADLDVSTDRVWSDSPDATTDAPDGCVVNACGRCGPLAANLGASCGRCGTYVCRSDNTDVSCLDPGLNACGACGTLTAAPNAACGQCGKYVCSADNSSVSCVDPGKNACDGCGVLGAAPGSSCGSCGVYACTADKTSVACNGPGTNACGGCGALTATPGAACGVCGTYVCSADKSSVSCSDPGMNACGGCGILAAQPNVLCGVCGKYVCSADKASVTCSDPGHNACGGCGTLAGAPNASCGTCGKYVCSADNSSVSCADPGANACGGCGTLAGVPNAACGTCGKYVCSTDKTSVSCADVTCGSCQICSAPQTCSTLLLNGAGQCSSTQYCNGVSTTCVTCPVPTSAGALHYVDPMYGTDDANHGGAYRNCGYKTLTYALAHATGQIALQTAIYSPQSGETFPIVLSGTQQLLCKFGIATSATIRGKAQYPKILINVSVAFEGTQNALFDCKIDGGGGLGYCVDVFSSGSAFPQQHSFSSVDIGNCGGTAILVENGVNNVSVMNSTIHDSQLGTFWAGSNTGGSMSNNSYATNMTDIQCSGADPGVTGSGNTGMTSGKPSCVTCGNCPF